MKPLTLMIAILLGAAFSDQAPYLVAAGGQGVGSTGANAGPGTAAHSQTEVGASTESRGSSRTTKSTVRPKRTRTPFKIYRTTPVTTLVPNGATNASSNAAVSVTTNPNVTPGPNQQLTPVTITANANGSSGFSSATPFVSSGSGTFAPTPVPGAMMQPTPFSQSTPIPRLSPAATPATNPQGNTGTRTNNRTPVINRR